MKLDGLMIKNFTLIWNMDCGKGQVLGFTTEALGFLEGLDGLIKLKVEVSNENQCLDDLRALSLPGKNNNI